MSVAMWHSYCITKITQRVGLQSLKNSFCKCNGIYLRCIKSNTATCQLAFYQCIVKCNIVRYKHFSMQHIENLSCYFGEFWRIGYHSLVNSGKLFNKRIDRFFRIDKTLKLINNFFAIRNNYGNFDNAISTFMITCGFYVNYRIHKTNVVISILLLENCYPLLFSNIFCF